MLTARNLEKIMELEEKLRAEYQTQLDAKSEEISKLETSTKDQKTAIAKQLEQISALSVDASKNKKVEQRNRELHQRCENLLEDVAKQKARTKTLQADLTQVREELAALKQFDPVKMKKNLDASKKKLAEKTTANDLLQKSYKQTKAENADLKAQLKALEAKLEELEPKDSEAEKTEVEQEAAA